MDMLLEYIVTQLDELSDYIKTYYNNFYCNTTTIPVNITTLYCSTIIK